jgi:signal transduction histidine kinase
MGQTAIDLDRIRATTGRRGRAVPRSCRSRTARREADLLASRARLVAAGDAARRQIERDLHDGAQQGLVSLAFRIRSLHASLAPEAEVLRSELVALATATDQVIDELRELSRGIHPEALARRGLGPALRALARRASVPVDVTVQGSTRPSDAVEVGAYFVVAEALANAQKHAQASAVTVDIVTRNGTVSVTVADDGIGGADPARGSGLVGLRDRVAALGGTLADTSPPGLGTTLVAQLPIEPGVTGGCSRARTEEGPRCA